MLTIGKRLLFLNYVVFLNLNANILWFRVSKEADIHAQPVQSSNPDSSLSQPENFFDDFMRQITDDNDRLMYIYIFTAIITATVIVTFIRSFVFISLAMRASRTLHNAMFQGNVSSPCSQSLKILLTAYSTT